MAEEHDDPPTPYIDRGFGRKKRRSTVDSSFGSPSMREVWLAERERAAKEQAPSSPSPDPESED